MNLNFNHLFDRAFGNRNHDPQDGFDNGDVLDRRENDDYRRDETNEHYLSEYRDSDAAPDKETSRPDDRFSREGRYYDYHRHERFGHSRDDKR